MHFLERAERLPVLGLGISTEFGAGDSPTGLDVKELRRRHPEFARFLEVGVETAKGLDRHALAWADAGLPTTYHFLDLNLDEPEDFDPTWLEEVRQLAGRIRPAWVCGDAGLWHFGGRERGHMLLLPPILSDPSARDLALGIERFRAAIGYEVLPENPPGPVFLGDLHLLDYFARAITAADTGLVLDAAHLAIYQRTMGHGPLDGLADFPLERVIEMHMAGGTQKEWQGYRFVEDDHTPEILHDTWEIFHHVVPRARNLRAVIYECERNPLPSVLPALVRMAEGLAASPLIGRAG